MKSIFIVLLSLLFFQINNLFADNWEPFPLNQTSYYKITEVKTPWLINYEDENLKNAITIIKFDSLYNENNQNSKYFTQLFRKIDNSLLSKRDSLKDKFDNFYNLSPDSYMIINDTLLFWINNKEEVQNNCFKIPLNLGINESFYQSNYDEVFKYTINIEIILKAKLEKTIFGITDSIITYQILRSRLPEKQDGIFTIEISKKFGFLKYIPLDILFPWSLSADIQQLELVAAKRNSEYYGETFDFQYRNRNSLEKSGDIKIFKNVWGYLADIDYAFIRDSITGVDDSQDFVYVALNRKIISTSQGDVPDSDKNYYYNYLKKDSIIYSGYNAMVDALKRGETFIPSTKLFDRVPNKDTEDKYDSLEVIAMPLLFKFVEKCGVKDLQIFYNYQATLDRTNCNLPTRYFFYRIIDKVTDLWWDHGQSDMIFEGNHIVGYINGDCEWGDLTWPPKGVSVKDIDENNINIFPNPVSDYIKFSSKSEGAVSYEIYNILGIKQLEGLIENEIYVELLPKGIYFLKLNKNNKVIKFIKE